MTYQSSDSLATTSDWMMARFRARLLRECTGEILKRLGTWVIVPVVFAHEQRPEAMGLVEVGCIDTPLLEALPFGGVVQIFAPLGLDNPNFLGVTVHGYGEVRR